MSDITKLADAVDKSRVRYLQHLEHENATMQDEIERLTAEKDIAVEYGKVSDSEATLANARIAKLEGENENIHRGQYHHPDCNYWKWDWRYSWSPTDCNCDEVCGPTEPTDDALQEVDKDKRPFGLDPEHFEGRN